jgi:hypothetical protein
MAIYRSFMKSTGNKMTAIEQQTTQHFDRSFPHLEKGNQAADTTSLGTSLLALPSQSMWQRLEHVTTSRDLCWMHMLTSSNHAALHIIDHESQ